MIPNVPMYALGAALVASMAWGGWQWRGKQSALTDAAKAHTALAEFRQQAAEAVARFEVEARATEQRHAADMTRIGREHREELDHAQSAADRLVADLRAGTVRLQERWRGCVAASGLPGTGGTPGGPDGEARDREESAARIVLAARQCDAQVKGLQKVVLSDRNGETP